MTSRVDPALAPTRFVDSDHPAIVGFARDVCGDATSDRERAARLFRTVRDRIRYDPYTVSASPEAYVASTILGAKSAYCVPKAIVLCAAARASGIRCWLGFADVKNHLASEKLRERMGTDLFAYHGYLAMEIDGVVRKASPAFNAELCARFGVPPLEFDGTSDALMHAYAGDGRRYMEYVTDRGLHLDLPLEEMLRTFVEIYGAGRPSRPKERDEAFES